MTFSSITSIDWTHYKFEVMIVIFLIAIGIVVWQRYRQLRFSGD